MIVTNTALAQTLRQLIRLCLEVEEARRKGSVHRPDLDRTLYEAERHAADMIGANDWEKAVQWAKETDAYADLIAEDPVDLDALEQDFEDMLKRMQSPEHSVAVDRLLALTPEQLGEAAEADAATDETDRE